MQENDDLCFYILEFHRESLLMGVSNFFTIMEAYPDRVDMIITFARVSE
jgi:hypothetical protein